MSLDFSRFFLIHHGWLDLLALGTGLQLISTFGLSWHSEVHRWQSEWFGGVYFRDIVLHVKFWLVKCLSAYFHSWLVELEVYFGLGNFDFRLSEFDFWLSEFDFGLSELNWTLISFERHFCCFDFWHLIWNLGLLIGNLWFLIDYLWFLIDYLWLLRNIFEFFHWVTNITKPAKSLFSPLSCGRIASYCSIFFKVNMIFN